MARILQIDWIPRYADAGYAEIIEALAAQGLDETSFIDALNSDARAVLPDINFAMFLHLFSDLARENRRFQFGIEVHGANVPAPNERHEAPGGLGETASM